MVVWQEFMIEVIWINSGININYIFRCWWERKMLDIVYERQIDIKMGL